MRACGRALMVVLWLYACVIAMGLRVAGLLVVGFLCAVVRLVDAVPSRRGRVCASDGIPYDDLRFVVKLEQHRGYQDS